MSVISCARLLCTGRGTAFLCRPQHRRRLLGSNCHISETKITFELQSCARMHLDGCCCMQVCLPSGLYRHRPLRDCVSTCQLELDVTVDSLHSLEAMLAPTRSETARDSSNYVATITACVSRPSAALAAGPVSASDPGHAQFHAEPLGRADQRGEECNKV